MLAHIFRFIKNSKGVIITFLAPLLLSPLPILVPGTASKGGFILILMAFYWITEVIPIYVTALLPVLLGPLLGVISSTKLCPAYMKDTNMLFLGGIFIACAIEHHSLHKRIALYILKVVGSDPKMLLAGFMLPTWFLSMWMSNTAATAMMITLIDAVAVSLTAIEMETEKQRSKGLQESTAAQKDEQLKEQAIPLLPSDKSATGVGDSDVTLAQSKPPSDAPPPDVEQAEPQESPSLRRFIIGFNMSVAYASTCGGIATLTGTPPNAVFLGSFMSRYRDGTGMNFGTFMTYAFPISIIMVVLMWFWLGLIYIGPRNFFTFSTDKEKKQKVAKVIDDEIEKMGKFKYSEGVVGFLFILIVILWITRKPANFGWALLFNTTGTSSFITDTQPALLICLLALVLPAQSPLYLWRTASDPNAPPLEFLLPWSVVHKKCPWGIMFLLGGGFALSDICEESGLSATIGAFLSRHMNNLPLPVLVLIASMSAALLTEFVSNVATASILLPIMFSLSTNLGIHPLTLSLPTTIGSSLAFSLPAGTPPNSIIFAKGRVRVKHMILTGYPMNLLGNCIILAATLTYARPLFGLDVLPSWAMTANATTAAVPTL